VNMTAQVQAKPAPAPSFAPVRTNLLQHKCACGGTPGPDGECAECRKKRLQRRSTGQAEPSTVPPIVNDVLRSPGQPLDPATRTFMEPRFGHDFSVVPAYADASKDDLPPRPAALKPTVQHATGPLYGPPLASQASRSTGSLNTQQAFDLAQEIKPLYPSGPGYVPFPPTTQGSGTCEVGHSGGNCYPDVGWTYLIRNDCCTKPCTQEHEDQHFRDFDGCCKAYTRALKKPGSGARVQEQWLAWKEQVRPISECRAYMNDISCAQRLASTKGCDSGTGQADKAGRDCCLDIAWYERTFAAEAAEWCRLARGKAIPPCPFTATPKKP